MSLKNLASHKNVCPADMDMDRRVLLQTLLDWRNILNELIWWNFPKIDVSVEVMDLGLPLGPLGYCFCHFALPHDFSTSGLLLIWVDNSFCVAHSFYPLQDDVQQHLCTPAAQTPRCDNQTVPQTLPNAFCGAKLTLIENHCS